MGSTVLLLLLCCAFVYILLQFFRDTEVELQHPRPHGFPPSGIWGYRIANVSLNLLNYLWFYKMASKASTLLSKNKKGKAGAVVKAA